MIDDRCKHPRPPPAKCPMSGRTRPREIRLEGMYVVDRDCQPRTADSDIGLSWRIYPVGFATPTVRFWSIQLLPHGLEPAPTHWQAAGGDAIEWIVDRNGTRAV